MTKKQVVSNKPKTIKLTNKGENVNIPVEGFTEMYKFATDCVSADDEFLKSRSKELVEAMRGFSKALHAVRGSRDLLFPTGLLAQAQAILDSTEEKAGKPMRPAQILLAERQSLRAAVPSRTDFLKR